MMRRETGDTSEAVPAVRERESERALVLSVPACVHLSGVSISISARACVNGNTASSRAVSFSARSFICTVRPAKVARVIVKFNPSLGRVSIARSVANSSALCRA